MDNIPKSTLPNTQFFGFWDSNSLTIINQDQKSQIIMWAKSILFFHPKAIVWLLTRQKIIPTNFIQIPGLHIIHLDNFKEIFNNTPLSNSTEKILTGNGISKPEYSDIIRIALLYRFGGSWVDIDDIVIRNFPVQHNLIGTIEWPGKTEATYWGSKFKLMNGNLMSSHYEGVGIHIQNDPMLNWLPQNLFLYKWMETIKTSSSVNWGQQVPTNLVYSHPNFVRTGAVTLWPQHFLLLHPAYGNRWAKGPMFPPHDLRIREFPNYDSKMDQVQFWYMVEQTLRLHTYSAVKNSKNVGIKQCNENKQERWFIGFLAQVSNINNILNRFREIDIAIRLERAAMVWNEPVKPVVIGAKQQINPHAFINAQVGQIPYTVYNTSILKLSYREYQIICKDKNLGGLLPQSQRGVDSNDSPEGAPRSGVVVFLWYAKPPNHEWGSMNWIAFAYYSKVLSILKDQPTAAQVLIPNIEDFWLIEPRLLQNVLGPKLADPRLFLIKKKNLPCLGLIGYTRVAPISNTPNIADYYVRASLINSKIKKPDEHENQKCNYGLSEIGCFPAKLKGYRPFVSTNINKTDNIELYLEANNGGTAIIPHKSKSKLMPDSLTLNGIEVSFSKTDTNENPQTHISTKNIVPLISVNPLELIEGFVDFAPPYNPYPKISITNMETGEVLFTSRLYLKNEGKLFRGSTPIIQLRNIFDEKENIFFKYINGIKIPTQDCLPNDIWITIVHRRKNNPLKYNLSLLIFSSRTITNNVNNEPTTLNIPNVGIGEIDIIVDDLISTGFIYPTGMIVDKIINNERLTTIQLLISYGISDKLSGLSKLSLNIPKICNINENNTLFSFAECIKKTYKKKTEEHSSHLKNDKKKIVHIGEIYKIVKETAYHYLVISSTDKNESWYIYKNHFKIIEKSPSGNTSISE